MATATRRIVRELPRIMMMQEEAATVKKMKVAAYARVSTEKEQQEDSFERQVEYYTGYIQSKPEWEGVGIYADPGISGTRAEKRPDFLRMIEDCRAGKIEQILVKSISRFARNTVDALNYIRELRDMHVAVHFESENIDTLTAGGEVLLTILAAMAEQESRTISTNIRWAYQRKFQNGEVVLNTGLMLGYRKADDGSYVVYEPEAEIIRRIYREFLTGTSIQHICNGLAHDGIKTRLGNSTWHTSNINSILTNEKYTGNAILGKTYKPDVLSKNRLKNDGEKAPMYYAEHSHPAIISMEIFERTKAELQRRKDARDSATGTSRYTSKYPFSGLLICGECGTKLRRHVRTVGSGKTVPSWGCASRIKNGRAMCDSRHVNEDVLERTYSAAIKKIVEDADAIVDTIKENAGEIMTSDAYAEIDAIGQQIIDVQEQVLTLHKQKQSATVSDIEYNEKMNEYRDILRELESKQEQLQETATRYAGAKAWLEDFEASIQNGAIFDATDAAIMKQMVEQIIVYSDRMEVRLKCGATVIQEYMK